MQKFSRKWWFTLIEMLVVIVVIWTLISALVPRLSSARAKANDISIKADLQQVATALISYQIDKWHFPSGISFFSDHEFQKVLIKWWMNSIPSIGENQWTGMDNQLAAGYMYYPMHKNWANNNGFLLVAKTESEQMSNYVYCGEIAAREQWDIDVDLLQLCDSVTFGETCNSSACIAKEKSDLRYIYKY